MEQVVARTDFLHPKTRLENMSSRRVSRTSTAQCRFREGQGMIRRWIFFGMFRNSHASISEQLE